MSPALETPQGATPAQPLSPLAQKIQKQIEEAQKGQTGYGSIPATLGQNRDGEAFISFDPVSFANAIGRSDSGKTEGCNLLLSGELLVPVEGMGNVTFIVEGRLPVKSKVKVAGM